MNHEVRHFRNDRILNIEILSEESHLSEIASDRAQQRSGKAQMVVIRSSKQNRFFFEENSEIVNRINEERDSLFVEFSIENTDWLLKAFCSLPGKVEIIEPTQMKTAFDERLDAILALYR
jgi:predicted DNA-binding transcriptional regulator YafY